MMLMFLIRLSQLFGGLAVFLGCVAAYGGLRDAALGAAAAAPPTGFALIYLVLVAIFGILGAMLALLGVAVLHMAKSSEVAERLRRAAQEQPKEERRAAPHF